MTRDDLLQLLRDLVACDDAGDHEGICNCIETAREIIEAEEPAR